MELRESSSPVPAHTIIVSLGAMARSPMEMTRSSSNTGRNDVPAFVVFQMPPAAAATKNVFDGLGMPSTSVIRPPMFAGPMGRQRNAARMEESSGLDTCAGRGEVLANRSAGRSRRARRCITAFSSLEWYA